MMDLAQLLTLRPIILGFIGMAIGGIAFPACGVIIIRNGLVSLRYALMHGIILGGTISLALKLPMNLTVITVNLILVLLMMRLRFSLSSSSALIMVFTMAFASLLAHVADVPSKDTLEILWGSPFALTSQDLWLMGSAGLVLILYCTLSFKILSAIAFDKETAISMGLNVRLHSTLTVVIAALCISVSMKTLGALLLDALLIIPALCAGRTSSSLKGMFIQASAYGLGFSMAGYMLALLFNLPVSAMLSILSAFALLITSLIKGARKK